MPDPEIEEPFEVITLRRQGRGVRFELHGGETAEIDARVLRARCRCSACLQAYRSGDQPELDAAISILELRQVGSTGLAGCLFGWTRAGHLPLELPDCARQKRWRRNLTMRGLAAKEWRSWWTIALGLPLAVYVTQLALLCVRFGQLPNYYASYNWPENIVRIIRSTPSLSDIVRIASDEWLFEVGRQSIIYGLTVSDWRLAVEPAKVLLLVLASAVAATNWVLARRGIVCSTTRTAEALTACGTTLASLTAVTISWVACCGVPSWVTGLTILGLSYSTALVLQPFGGLLVLCGFAALAGGTALLTVIGAWAVQHRS